jgi:hypothetical protein
MEHVANQYQNREGAVDLTLPDKGFWRNGLFLLTKQRNKRNGRPLLETLRLFCIPASAKQAKRYISRSGEIAKL